MLQEAINSTLKTTSRDLVLDLGWKSTALFVVFVWWMSRGSSPVYMVDFSTFEPPEDWKVNERLLLPLARLGKGSGVVTARLRVWCLWWGEGIIVFG